MHRPTTQMKNPTDEIEFPLSDHLEDLRSVVIKVLCVIFIGFLGSLYFHHEVFSIITAPLKSITPTIGSSVQKELLTVERHLNTSDKPISVLLKPGTRAMGVASAPSDSITIPAGGYVDIEKVSPNQLVIFSPVEGMITTLKVCFWVSLVGTAPIWLYFFLQFAIPGLHPTERKLLFPFLFLSTLFITAGLAFAFYLTLPLANTFLWTFNSEIGQNLWSLTSYLDYTLFLLLANALAFEISLILFFLVQLGIVTHDHLTTHRRHAIVAALILAALLTPPDVPSQVMLAVPLILLYECAILFALFVKKKSPQQAVASS